VVVELKNEEKGDRNISNFNLLIYLRIYNF